MAKHNVLIYLFRRDVRVTDNPILNYLATTPNHGFTHLLPVYIFQAQQMEVSGFLREGTSSPYPPAKSRVARYWRCGPHRAKFVVESVWSLKTSLESLDSGLLIRVGMIPDVTKALIEGLEASQHHVGAVWMTDDVSIEEIQDERAVAKLCKSHGIDFKAWLDEKYFIDDRDLGISKPQDLPDIFTTYRKTVEPLREKPRKTLPRPAKSSLPAFLEMADTPKQQEPFVIPEEYKKLEENILRPIRDFVPNIPQFPEGAVSAHPFKGGEDSGLARLAHLVNSGLMKTYKDTRNGLIGSEFSTKLSAYLVHGSITARQVHDALLGYEDGSNDACKGAPGFGKGECEGTKSVRFELLWRDYMRLCTKKFTHRLFDLEGFRGADKGKADYEKTKRWKSPNEAEAQKRENIDKADVSGVIERFNAGTTGMGLIDASQRELLHTGYTSNRTRQNTASFLAKHLDIDWRYGAEWYEMLLVDYDVSSNWANWQYVAGVGNDPRGEARIFNPVKQAFDYDSEGNYVRTWLPELAKLTKLENLFQAWTASEEEIKEAGLEGNLMVTHPVKRIDFSVDGKPRNPKRPFIRRRGHGRQQKSVDGPPVSQGHPGSVNNIRAEAAPVVVGQHPRQMGQWTNRTPVDGTANRSSENFRGGFRGGLRGGRGFHSGRGTYSGRGGFRGRPYGRGSSGGVGHDLAPGVNQPNA